LIGRRRDEPQYDDIETTESVPETAARLKKALEEQNVTFKVVDGRYYEDAYTSGRLAFGTLHPLSLPL
jgi:predicted nucleic acid-binding Zn ribbon protein